MRNLLFLITLMVMILSCGSGDKYIKTNAFEWSVELKNGDRASGVAGTEEEAKKQIIKFSKHNKSGVKNRNVKTIKVKTKRSSL